MVKQTPFQKNKSEIRYHIINCVIAGALVTLGGVVSAGLTWTALGVGLLAGLLACVVKFKEYWSGQKDEYTSKILTFI